MLLSRMINSCSPGFLSPHHLINYFQCPCKDILEFLNISPRQEVYIGEIRRRIIHEVKKIDLKSLSYKFPSGFERST